jgi:hypothetical protein
MSGEPSQIISIGIMLLGVAALFASIVLQTKRKLPEKAFQRTTLLVLGMALDPGRDDRRPAGGVQGRDPDLLPGSPAGRPGGDGVRGRLARARAGAVGMTANLAAVAYLISGVLFILALRGLSSPETSQGGNASHGRHGAGHRDHPGPALERPVARPYHPWR